MDHNFSNENEVRALLKGLSPRDFLKIGMNEIAYVRAVKLEGITSPAFGVYAADGTQISLLESKDMAMETLRHNDLLPVTLH